MGQEIFGVAEAQAEAVIEPDGVTDDLRRKRVAMGRLAWVKIRRTLESTLRRVFPHRRTRPTRGRTRKEAVEYKSGSRGHVR